MGMKAATFWVTKITRPILAFFRALQIKCTNYIDDWLGADHPDRAEATRLFMTKILELLGFLINMKKSSDFCTSVIVHLGIEIDAPGLRWRIPDKKKATLCEAITSLLADHTTNGFSSQRKLRRLTGLAASLTVAFRQINLWLRGSFSALRPHHPHWMRAIVSAEGLADLRELLALIPPHQGTLFDDFTPDASLLVDAGETGFGGALYHLTQDLPVSSLQRPLPSPLVGTSSTCRELYGADQTLTAKAHLVANSSLELKMDSAPGVRILLKGGSKIPHLSVLAKSIHTTCSLFNIRLLPTWISRDLNTEADDLSKRWARLHQVQIDPLARSLISVKFPTTTVSMIQFGRLPHFFRKRKNSPRSLPPMVLIHPVWTAQQWWPLLLELRKDSLPLGSFADLFSVLPPDLACLKNKPRWQFQASLL